MDAVQLTNVIGVIKNLQLDKIRSVVKFGHTDLLGIAMPKNG